MDVEPSPQVAAPPAPASQAPASSAPVASAGAVDYRAQHDELKAKYDALMGIVSYDPESRAAVQRAYNRARGLQEEAPPAPSDEEAGKGEPSPAQPSAPVGPTHVDMAFTKLATSLGNGDPYKGQALFEKDYLKPFEDAAAVLYGDNADAKVALLKELVDLRLAKTRPSQPVDQLRDIGLSGERGEAGRAPVTPPDMSKWSAYQRADWHSRNSYGVGIDELTRAAFTA